MQHDTDAVVGKMKPCGKKCVQLIMKADLTMDDTWQHVWSIIDIAFLVRLNSRCLAMHNSSEIQYLWGFLVGFSQGWSCRCHCFSCLPATSRQKRKLSAGCNITTATGAIRASYTKQEVLLLFCFFSPLFVWITHWTFVCEWIQAHSIGLCTHQTDL